MILHCALVLYFFQIFISINPIDLNSENKTKAKYILLHFAMFFIGKICQKKIWQKLDKGKYLQFLKIELLKSFDLVLLCR